MKKTLIAVLSASQVCLGANYVMDLSSYSNDPPDSGDGADGWVQSEADSPVDAPRSFITAFGSGNGLSLGGYYNTDPQTGAGSGIILSRSFSPLSSVGSSLVLEFAITDSETAWDVDRNRFSISMGDGLTERVGLVFVPVAQSTDPDAQTDAAWNVYLSVLGTMETNPFCAIYETIGGAGIYSLSLVTGPTSTAGEVSYHIGITAAGDTFTTNGSYSGASGAEINSLNFGWKLNGDETDGLGGNFMTIGSAVVAVPEPSGAILLSCGLLGAMMRRRRPVA